MEPDLSSRTCLQQYRNYPRQAWPWKNNIEYFFSMFDCEFYMFKFLFLINIWFELIKSCTKIIIEINRKEQTFKFW